MNVKGSYLMKNQLKIWMKESRSIVFFGGAGVSTESQIPDFRSADGLYQAKSEFNHRPEEMLSHDFFVNEPETFYRYYRGFILHPEAKPNAAHCALVEWEKMGNLAGIVTQNIDGLHQAAGSKNVMELHGSVHRNYCVGCGATYPLSFMVESEGISRCRKCGDIVRPDVTLYGEGLANKVTQAAIELIRRADMLIVGGTSLVVYPAAGLLRYFRGNRLVLINKEATPFDDKAQLIVRESIGKVLKETLE
ncbi:NAD-dependent protein deacylase [Gottschalkiaceae bacterium SANA]|nr:NAD-dependent protein deacylase [Gottschalkiaceae bacterium SANA]